MNKKEDKKESRKEDSIDYTSSFDELVARLESDYETDYNRMIEEELQNKEERLKDFDYMNKTDITQHIPSSLKNEEDDFARALDLSAKSTRPIERIRIDSYEAPIIKMENLKVVIDKDLILKNINLAVNRGEFVYFVGESGAGKSTMIRLLYREIKNKGGILIVDGDNLTKMPSRKLPYLRRKIGIIFQDFRLLENKTVYENVRFSLEVVGYPRSKRKARVHEVLNQVGILDKRDKYPSELSGGQQQRVAIARAIVDEPLIIVADEPTGNLDPENAIAIMEILEKINESGTTLLMATHDVGIVNRYKHRVVLMKNGEIAKEVKGEYIYE